MAAAKVISMTAVVVVVHWEVFSTFTLDSLFSSLSSPAAASQQQLASYSKQPTASQLQVAGSAVVSLTSQPWWVLFKGLGSILVSPIKCWRLFTRQTGWDESWGFRKLSMSQGQMVFRGQTRISRYSDRQVKTNWPGPGHISYNPLAHITSSKRKQLLFVQSEEQLLAREKQVAFNLNLNPPTNYFLLLV